MLMPVTPLQIDDTCFHCGLPLPVNVEYHVHVDNAERSMCCAGCMSVAQTIVDAGLSDYYNNRSALPSPADNVPDFIAEARIYNLPDLQTEFVHRDANILDASLLLEDVRCSACLWLIEQRLRQLPGMHEVSPNYSARRVRVRWREGVTKLSDVIAAIGHLGYRASPFDPEKAEATRRAERREAIKRLAIAALCMMQVMMFAVPAYLAKPDEITMDQSQLMRWASLLLTIPVLLYSGREFFIGAWRSLSNCRAGIDVPVALGIGVAFTVSVWNTWAGSGDVYFDSATMFVFLLLLSRFLEQQARSRSGDVLERLTRILPKHCQRFNDYPASHVANAIASTQLHVGDYLLIGSGEHMPVDGVVIEGTGENDESLISGESRPINKSPGSAVIAGAVNLGNPLIVRATAVGTQNTVAQIARLVDRALSEKPRIARLADQAAAWFLWVLFVVAAAVTVNWSIHPSSGKLVPIIIALLVITCPCALSLAVPAVLSAATHRLAGFGLLPTRSHAIEALSKVTDVVFDKTGTLTRGMPTLVQVTLLGKQSESEVIAIAAALEASSQHPLGKALRSATKISLTATALTTKSGAGIEGKIDGVLYRIGTLQFVRGITHTQPLIEPQTAASSTLVALGNEHGWLAFFHFTDSLRPESRSVVEQLARMGKTVHLLSGDSPGMAAHIAIEAGIMHGRGAATPEQKLNYIHALQSNGAVIAMIGDGINDAPSLAVSQVSIAMGDGTDVAQTAADMVLLSGNLNVIPQALHTANVARRIIRQNLAWAVAYNLVAIPLAAFGAVTPLAAAIGMSVSSLIVVFNALRVARAGKFKTHSVLLRSASAGM